MFIKGSLASVDDLPATGGQTEGMMDAWLINGDLWVWDLENTQWVNVGQIQGPAGEPGTPGTNGTSVTILGSYDTVAALKAAHPYSSGKAGDGYLVNGDLYVWITGQTDWVNAGRIQGPAGPIGPEGPQGPSGFGGAHLVILYANGGEPIPLSPMAVEAIEDGALVDEPAGMKKTRYDFAGWYESPTFAGSAWDFEKDVCTRTIYLFAKWVSGLTDLDLTATPYLLAYETGDELQIAGLEAYAVYSDGTRDLISHDDLVITGFDTGSTTLANTPGRTATVAFTHEGVTKTAQFYYTVRSKGITFSKAQMDFDFTRPNATDKVSDLTNMWGSAPVTQDLVMTKPGANNTNSSWTVSDPSVVELSHTDFTDNNDGTYDMAVGSSNTATVTVTVKKPGHAIITATTPDGTSTVRCNVFVYTADGMMGIKSGTFMMGSPADEPNRNVNEIQHQVTMAKDFYFSKTLVTQQEYTAVTKAADPSASGGQGYPVSRVSWYMALVYCNLKSMQEGLQPVYRINGFTDPKDWPGVTESPNGALLGIPTSDNTVWNAASMVTGSNGYRLPTEAEWEYVCRAGTTTPCYNGKDIFEWGVDIAGGGSSIALTKGQAVGSYAPNAWGLYDMNGNGFEYCWDRFGDYPAVTTTDYRGPSVGDQRVKRGGPIAMNSRTQSIIQARSAYRYYSPPSAVGGATTLTGIRVVRGGL